MHDTSAWLGRLGLSTLVRPFFCYSQWLFVFSEPRIYLVLLKINVLFLPYLYLSFQGRFCFPIASPRLDFMLSSVAVFSSFLKRNFSVV